MTKPSTKPTPTQKSRRGAERGAGGAIVSNFCLKGTNFMCPCDTCMEELRQKAQAHSAHLSRLKTDTTSYWTNQYSARDKADTVTILRAGFEHHEKCKCLFCQVERDKAEEVQNA